MLQGGVLVPSPPVPTMPVRFSEHKLPLESVSVVLAPQHSEHMNHCDYELLLLFL